MIKTLKILLTRTAKPAPEPVCRWGGPHSGAAVRLLEIERGCGHVEPVSPACQAHVELLMSTGGVAERPAPCFEEDCGVVSRARIRAMTVLPVAAGSSGG